MKSKKCHLTIFLTLIIIGVQTMFAQTQNLMPVPQKVLWQSGKIRVDSSFRVQVKGKPHPRLYKGIERMVARLAGRTGLFIPQRFFDPQQTVDRPALVVTVHRSATIRLNEDETYTLNISASEIRLQAETDLGALHGLETLLQLLSADADGYYFPAVRITDAPRFSWRGLMIDACRHFMPVEVIKRNLDGMAAVKLNVLHWHLSEDQGFRVECKSYPKLYQLGSDGMYYTQAQIKEVIRYAADRGIRVMPEFDLPGHATSWLVGYPELASAPGPYKIERNWGIFNPTFNPTIEQTYTFLDAFFKEMSVLFPDAFMHIGGDENNGKQWNANPQIQSFMKARHLEDNHALQSYFNNRLLKILTRYGKKMVGWDEILHKDMPTNIVIQSWRGRDSMIKAAQQGYQTILSNGYYIDLIQPTDYHYLNDPAPQDLPLSPEQRKLILGGEATMWSEMVSPETVDSRIWPRTAAIAERLWSAAEIRDVDDMYRRLKTVSFRLEELGLTHEKNYGMLLRRLTGNNDITALKILVDVIEPVRIYNRNRLRKQYSYTPLTRVVDAARPDPVVARDFRKLVDLYLSAGADRGNAEGKIKNQLQVWAENNGNLQPIIDVSPVLFEIRQLSQNLSAVARLGLEALAYRKNPQEKPADWNKHGQTILEQAAQPQAQTNLMIVDAVKKLVN